ncbi:MAG: hypothetical protein ACOX6W_01770 [Lentisphaeria bacterium]|jgi:hypothetical protein
MAYKLTEKRLQKATPILEEGFAFLVKTKGEAFLPRSFEYALRDCWNIGYQELKSIMLDMLRHDKYKYLAVRYMEFCDGTGVKSEFKQSLARLHGVKGYDHLTYNMDRKPFWEGFISLYCN